MTSRNVGRHHRHLIELASLLATAGLADAFADVFGARRHGSSALIGLGVALIVGTVGHHIWLRRTDHAPPAVPRAMPAVAAVPAITSSSSCAAPTSVFWRMRTEIDNTPGRLAVLAGALAAAGANIHALEAHPAPTGVIDVFLIEASKDTTAEHLCAAINAVGGRDTRAVPTDVLALLDAPTRALELAARLVRTPDSLGTVLTDLLDADTLAIDMGEPGTADEWIDDTALVLRRADGTTFTAIRPGMPFTTTELSRARAIADLMTTCPSHADCLS